LFDSSESSEQTKLPIMNSTVRDHWWEVLKLENAPGLAKTRWRILREGASLDEVLTAHPSRSSWQILKQTGDMGSGAIKCLLQSNDFDDACEMVVLFPKSGDRATVCVSSQIGCAVGCQFCATGTMGFQRNLTRYEILEQVYWARRVALQHERSLRNVVFMGMGEPLHNIEEVWASIHCVISDKGFGISPRSVTLSTALGGTHFLETARQFPKLRLALSLHSVCSPVRKRLVPKSPSDMERLREVIREINCLQGNEPVWLEITLLKGINDTRQEQEALVRFCEGLQVQINLIPYNPIEVSDRSVSHQSGDPRNGSLVVIGDTLGGNRFEGTGREDIFDIARFLRSHGLVVRVRHSFGDQDNAACGQLVLHQSAAQG
jgi:23S rRNA (adenine2503-C2)-methyltransferase